MGDFPYVIRVFPVRRLTVRSGGFCSVSALVLSFPQPATLWHYGSTCMRQVGRDHVSGEVGSIHQFRVVLVSERHLWKHRVKLQRWISSVSSTFLAVLSSCSTRHTLTLRDVRCQIGRYNRERPIGRDVGTVCLCVCTLYTVL